MTENIIELLYTGEYSCVIAKGDEVRTFKRRGVVDLYELLLQEPACLKEARIADKVVGKAAAALMLLGGVEEVYAGVISLPALTLLHDSGVKVQGLEIVDYIQNRSRTGWCPLETICRPEKSAEDVLPLVKEFIEKMNR